MELTESFNKLVLSSLIPNDGCQASADDIFNAIDEKLKHQKNDLIISKTGDLLVTLIKNVAHLSKRLISSDEANSCVEQDADEKLIKMDEDGDTPDLDYLLYMAERDRKLRTMNQNLQDYALKLAAEWEHSQEEPPDDYIQASALLQNGSAPRAPSIKSWDHMNVEMVDTFPTNDYPLAFRDAHLSTLSNNPDSAMVVDDLEDDMQGMINDLIDRLATRGKGEYLCPLGENCRKAGLEKDGSPKKFDRNSAFRTHLEKHGKRYRCTEPGCRNKDGFARKDQLRRHLDETSFHKPKGRDNTASSPIGSPA